MAALNGVKTNHVSLISVIWLKVGRGMQRRHITLIFPSETNVGLAGRDVGSAQRGAFTVSRRLKPFAIASSLKSAANKGATDLEG
jgi:hypothetical protein